MGCDRVLVSCARRCYIYAVPTTLSDCCYLLCFGGVNGNHAGVERHRIAGSPANEATALPFFRLVGQHMLSSVVDVVAIVARFASVQLDHVLADDFIGREAQQTLHARIDVADIKMAVRHCYQFCREIRDN